MGALLAVTLLKHVIDEARLSYLLATVGGVMLAVCAVELWPEGRRCGHDDRLGQGVVLGSTLMTVTLLLGG